MADIENQQEPTLLAKRKPEIHCQDHENLPNKTQKLQSVDKDSSAPEEKQALKEENNRQCEGHYQDSSAEEKTVKNSSNSQEKLEKETEENLNNDGEDYEEEEEEGDEDEDEDEHDDDDDEEEEEEDLSGETEVDRKGKGIARDDKGKGKLIKEEDSDDDDSSDGGNQSKDDSDFSDDPLAEVDMDNILPSRTRRRVVAPGAYIANDLESDSDSDDSDA